MKCSKRETVCLGLVWASASVGLWLEVTDPSKAIYAFAVTAAATVVMARAIVRQRIAARRAGGAK